MVQNVRSLIGTCMVIGRTHGLDQTRTLPLWTWPFSEGRKLMRTNVQLGWIASWALLTLSHVLSVGKVIDHCEMFKTSLENSLITCFASASKAQLFIFHMNHTRPASSCWNLPTRQMLCCDNESLYLWDSIYTQGRILILRHKSVRYVTKCKEQGQNICIHTSQ